MTEWRRPSGCESSACAEVQVLEDGTLIRSSRTKVAISFTAAEWRELVRAVKDGEFDWPNGVESAASG